MINRIEIRNIATFDDTEHVMENLGKLNFIFGANGSGKTTISKVLANPDDFPSCKITWNDNVQLPCKVYNTNFVQENFVSFGQMPGIFLLGKGDIDTQKTIEKLEKKYSDIIQKRNSLNTALYGEDGNGGKQAALNTLIVNAREKFWSLKQKYDGLYIKKGMEGFNASKEKFFHEVFSQYEANGNIEEALTLEQLNDRAKLVFDKELTEVDLLPAIVFDDLYELQHHEILAQKVVGKEDIDIGALINKLENSDWVKKGTEYIEASGGCCPFCQRPLSSEFKSQLEEYFDDVYQSNLNKINKLSEKYKNTTKNILQDITSLLDANSSWIDNEKLRLLYETLKSIFDDNTGKIASKFSNASVPVTLNSVDDVISQINAVIKDANDSITEHNRIVNNKKEEQTLLKKQIWYFIISEMTPYIKEHLVAKNELSLSIERLKKDLYICEQEKKQIEEILRKEHAKLTSVVPAMNAINDMLQKFGFSGFKLAIGTNEHSYKIIRDNGETVNDTLSEGEKNFITFLYFYALLDGSLESTGITGSQVIVIDDPVSSMDSDVMFIVSALINRLKWLIEEGQSSIKQLIIETHNLFFYKEVTPCLRGKNKKITRQWIVRKIDGKSTINAAKEDVVQSTYEMLWYEIRRAMNCPTQVEQVSLQNAMRRILEYYFKFLGNQKINQDIIGQIDSNNRILAHSLMALVNAGSHGTFDDLYCAPFSEDAIVKSLAVFRDIFYLTGHKAHYNMMMRITEEDENGEAQNAQP